MLFLETCSECGGAVKVIASIEDPVVIKKILAHLNRIIPAPDLLDYPKVEPRRKLVC